MSRNPLDLDSVRQCKKCPLLGHDHVPSDGNPAARLMIIGRDPTRGEVEVRTPFTGPCGEIIEYMLDEIGLDRTDVYITNTVKCYTPDRNPHPEELSTCARTWLFQEIKQVNPDVILLLGKDVHVTLMGAKDYNHLEVHEGKHRAAITAYHPGYVLRQGTMAEYIPAVAGIVKTCLDNREGGE